MCHPSELRNRVRQQPQLLFALLQRGEQVFLVPVGLGQLVNAQPQFLFQALALSDIHQHTRHPNRPSRAVALGQATSRHPPDRAVGLHDPVVRLVGLASFNGTVEGRSHLTQIVGVD